MILLACTEFSRSLVQPHLMKELLSRNNLYSEICTIYVNPKHFDISVDSYLIQKIREAELILLFIQPYPIADWDDPFDTFYTMIYSFMTLQPCTRRKTIYVTPFVIWQNRNTGVTMRFMEMIVSKAKLGHFAIHPEDHSVFLNCPPYKDQFTYSTISPGNLLTFYEGLLALCQQKTKKSFKIQSLESSTSHRPSNLCSTE
jgi:hypothetical protein